MAKAKDLEEALVKIETKLGGEKKSLNDLGEHLEYIESLISGESGGGTKLYKHSILVKNGDYITKIFHITSVKQTVVSLEQDCNFSMVDGDLIVDGDDHIYTIANFYTLLDGEIALKDYSGNFVTYTYETDYTAIADTVRPL